MLPHAVLCRFDALARSVRGNVEPFGGIQMLLSGDFHKLPPVAGRSIFPQPSGGREVSAECAAGGFQTIQLKDSFASGALPRDAIHDTFLKGVREGITTALAVADWKQVRCLTCCDLRVRAYTGGSHVLKSDRVHDLRGAGRGGRALQRPGGAHPSDAEKGGGGAREQNSAR